jgi:hypothetical protein
MSGQLGRIAMLINGYQIVGCIPLQIVDFPLIRKQTRQLQTFAIIMTRQVKQTQLMHDTAHIVVCLLANASKLDIPSEKDQRLRHKQMSLGIVLLTRNVTISYRYDQINERVEGRLLETIHILDKSIPICARHDGKVCVYQAKRQVVHMLGAQSNKVLLLAQRGTQTNDNAHVRPEFIRVFVLQNEVFEYVEGTFAIVLEYARDETREVDRFVPVDSFVHERQTCGRDRVLE